MHITQLCYYFIEYWLEDAIRMCSRLSGSCQTMETFLTKIPSPCKVRIIHSLKVNELKTNNKTRGKISPKHGDFPRRAWPLKLPFLADAIRIQARTKGVNTISEKKRKEERKKAHGSCAAIITSFFQWYKHLCLLGTPSSCLRCYSNIYFSQCLTACIIFF